MGTVCRWCSTEGKAGSRLAAACSGPGMLGYITHSLQVKIQKHLLPWAPAQQFWIQNKPSRSQVRQAQPRVPVLRFPRASVSVTAWCVCSSEWISVLTTQSVTASHGDFQCYGDSTFYCCNLSLKTSSGKGDTGKWTPNDFYDRLL